MLGQGTSTRPQTRIQQLRGAGTIRKYRLFACACARRALSLIPKEGTENCGLLDNAVEVIRQSEALADGLLSSAEFVSVEQSVIKAVDEWESVPIIGQVMWTLRCASWTDALVPQTIPKLEHA